MFACGRVRARVFCARRLRCERCCESRSSWSKARNTGVGCARGPHQHPHVPDLLESTPKIERSINRYLNIRGPRNP
eukprot:3414548-Amphidinium_carterae.1